MNISEKLAKMGFFEKWLYALKIKSWPKLLVPFLLGQGFGLTQSDNPSYFIVCLGLLFTIFLLGYIVLLNDYADINVDTIKRKLFPNDCSPKTIPDNILSQNSVLAVGLALGIISILIAILIQYYTKKDYILIFSLLCVFVFAAYSLPPIRLNYRGGGEFLEMIGVGFMLPIFHFYLQAGMKCDTFFSSILLISTLFAFSSALASGLSDEESDRLGGKTTFVTFFGNRRVRQFINITVVSDYILFLGFSFLFESRIPLYIALILIPYFLYHLFFILKISKFAQTNEFDSQRTYKDHLHKLIWGFVSLFTILINLDYYCNIK